MRGRRANRYPKRVKYGNRRPNRDADTWQASDPSQLPNDTWMLEVVFDYGEGHYLEDAPDAEKRIFARARIVPPAESHWPVRQDPFSSYRAGFDVRTYRLCQRVLMLHHFPDELRTPDYLVRSTEFTYSASPIASFITQVTQSGYVREPDGTYLKKSLPPVSFEYSKAVIHDEIETIDPESLQNLPVGVSGVHYQWLDMDGEGLQGVLYAQQEGWYYKRNLSPISVVKDNGREKIVACFEPLTRIATQPSIVEGADAQYQFLDLAGDGNLDLVRFEKPVSGFFERTQDERWENLIPFRSAPNVEWNDPNLRFIDLTGDGHADILITEDGALTWYPSMAEEGFGTGIRIPVSRDEEEGPALVFADGTQTIYAADLSGDGLSDIVRIRNGEVCYWPNLGYGRFGAKVTMDNAPWFDTTDQFDPRRIRVADIDGSGTTDMIYMERSRVAIYRNECGNGWSPAEYLSSFPPVDDLSSVTAVDLLGNGTSCLVWSSPLPSSFGRPMHYIDLMGGQKPHLLVKTINNLGAETRVQYAPSTRFYLLDKYAGKPWITRLPFPVHVVERVDTYDHISRNRFVTRYAYHHGYFDGEEREFRGFGMVEQFDTEELGALTESGDFPDAVNIDAASYVPTVLTKTWFHTGIYLGRDHVSDFFAGLLDADDIGEYYREPGLTDAQARALLLDDTVLPHGLSVDEEREACRSLKGAMLRQEVYALDGTDKEQHPYVVTEQNFTIRVLQRQAGNRHAVFFTHAREAVNYHYERNPTDPRIAHALTLEVDEFANVLKSVAIGYGRRQPDLTLPLLADREQQTRTHITYTENGVTNAIDDFATHPDDYRTPLPGETRTYELTGFEPENSAARFSFDEWTGGHFALSASAVQIPYEETANNTTKQRRLIEQARTLYRPDDLGASRDDPLALLPLGTVELLALAGEGYHLAFTPGLLAQVYPENLLPDPAAVLPVDGLGGQAADRGGYVDLDGNGHWWIPSGRVFLSPNHDDASTQELAYAREHFFLPHRYRNPFHSNNVSTESHVTYDVHTLLMLETRDALGNSVRTVGDYRVLAPGLMTDPNDNRSQVAFDALGMVVGTAVMGKATETLGDLLDASFEPGLTEAQLDAFMAGPRETSANGDESVSTKIVHDLLGNATTRIIYDLDRFKRLGEPPFSVILARETHLSELRSGQQTRIDISFSYSDGFGREIQKKIQAEPGPVPKRDATDTIMIGADSQPVMTVHKVSPRWVGTGWTIFNNKGKPVRQYEPFFSDTHRFELDVKIGGSPVMFYDSVDRVVAALHPNHTYEKVAFDPWQQTTYDVNDNVTFNPKEDDAVKEFFTRLPDSDYLPTWYGLRTNPAHAAEAALKWPDPKIRDAEKGAAEKTTKHAHTPAVTHFDSLGRPFLTVTHNKFDRLRSDNTIETVEEKYPTRVELDIEGNQRAVIDAKDRVVMRYDYDMLGTRIHQGSMEAGERWVLNDVTGKPIRAWDSRGHQFMTEYDQLRRSLRRFVRGTDLTRSDPRTLNRDVLAAKTEYGEGRPNDTALNLRTRVFKHYDSAGVVTSMARNLLTNQDEAYDFKGNLLRGSRRLVGDYKGLPDWSQQPALELEIFAASTFDALNRPLSVTAPDNSVYRPTFNEADLLEKVEVTLRSAQAPTSFVTNIDYNPKGQRELIAYANGAITTYTYDPDTSRLSNLETTRPSGANGLASQIFKDAARVQDLRYTYDPAGNISRIEDAALAVVFHDNQRVDPVSDYTYDAVYRLIEASGREHIGQAGFQFNPPNGNYRDYPFLGVAQLNDLQAVRNYNERYEYDAVGNFLQLIHQATNGNWARGYSYNEPSTIEPSKKNNRLSSTMVGANNPETYTYDAHGNLSSMRHLPLMQWDHLNQLRATSRQVVNNGARETIFYVYDATGQRVRKVTERQNGTRKNERTYLGGFETYREYDGAGTSVALERETLHVMDDKQRIALVETKTLDVSSPLPPQASLIRYQFDNHLGSATLELDKAGQIISYEEYSPYGSTSYQAGRSAAEVGLKRYRYTGMERDEETGFTYHGARYYTPWIGRWVSCDPKGLSDSENLYVHSRSSPIRFVDTTGLESRAVSEEVTNLVQQIHRRYEFYINDLRASGLTDPRDLGREAGKLMEDDLKGLFGRGAAELVYDSQMPGGKTRVDITFRKEKLEVELKLSWDAVRDKQDSALRDTAEKRGRTLVYVTESEYAIYEPEGLKRSPQQRRRLAAKTSALKSLPLATEAASAPGRGGGVGLGGLVTTAGLVVAGLTTLLGPGSLREGAKSLVTDYVVGKGVQAITTGAVGANLASTVGGAVGFALSLCGDQASACEHQAKMSAQKESENEINERAYNIFDTTPGKSFHQAREIAISQMYVEQGLDKVEKARQEFQKNFAEMQERLRRGQLPPILYDNSPRMNPR